MENKKKPYIGHPRVKVDFFIDQQEEGEFVKIISDELLTLFDEAKYCPDPYESWLTAFIATAGNKAEGVLGNFYNRVCTFITEDILEHHRNGNLLEYLKPHMDLYRLQFSESNPKLYNSRQ